MTAQVPACRAWRWSPREVTLPITPCRPRALTRRAYFQLLMIRSTSRHRKRIRANDDRDPRALGQSGQTPRGRGSHGPARWNWRQKSMQLAANPADGHRFSHSLPPRPIGPLSHFPGLYLAYTSHLPGPHLSLGGFHPSSFLLHPSLRGGFGGALGSHWGRIGVALGSH